MAELTANFNDKDITVTYPDSMIGKSEEAFVTMNSNEWESFLQDKLDPLDEDEPSEEQLNNWKYEFTVGCIVNHIKQVIRSYEIKTAMMNVEQQAKTAVDEALGQISIEIEEDNSSSGPSFV
tara:strand:+ start:276 stop:641 length:366 start_codon:yes stop_codon:yes gene_type:complete